MARWVWLAAALACRVVWGHGTMARMPSLADELHRPGNWLCHYTRADTAFSHIVPFPGCLRLSPYAETNDPAENKALDPPKVSGDVPSLRTSAELYLGLAVVA